MVIFDIATTFCLRELRVGTTECHGFLKKKKTNEKRWHQRYVDGQLGDREQRYGRGHNAGQRAVKSECAAQFLFFF